ncbi:MAG: flavin reductase family protein [Clostridia bacterium]|nr:flavin reductase family protein [Clostridia bacterium]
MALKVKVGKIGLVDALKFKNLPATRDKVIEAAPAKEITADFPINNNAKKLHPDCQKMVITKIRDHGKAEAKTFFLKRADGEKAAYFRAGQYLSIALNIKGSEITRPYSISCSPSFTAEGMYTITVKKNQGGFAADYILKNWKEGTEVTVSEPLGSFFYEPLRDAKNVVALAGGSGITPFLSMAYAIRDGIEDFCLTVLFGSRTKDSILLGKELANVAAAANGRVKIVNVLSEEEADGFEHGFITADLIKKYAPDGEYSVFICGPEAMYRFLVPEIAKLGLEAKYVRRELLGVTKDVSGCEGYPPKTKTKKFALTVRQGENIYETTAKASEPLLVAIERAGIAAPSRCRSGECGWCRSKLVSGEVFTPAENEGRRYADKQNGYIHPCCAFPVSDIVIEVPGTYMK